MARTVEDFLGDGDGPATEGQKEETRGPLLIMARPVEANWRVSREGEVVVLQIGNLSPLRIRWEGALLFAQAVASKAVEAKVQAGAVGKRLEARP